MRQAPPAAPFAAARRELTALQPAYMRLLVDWAALQPDPRSAAAARSARSTAARAEVGPCGAYAGLRAELAAIASQQRARRRRGALPGRARHLRRAALGGARRRRAAKRARRAAFARPLRARGARCLSRADRLAARAGRARGRARSHGGARGTSPTILASSAPSAPRARAGAPSLAPPSTRSSPRAMAAELGRRRAHAPLAARRAQRLSSDSPHTHERRRLRRGAARRRAVPGPVVVDPRLRRAGTAGAPGPDPVGDARGSARPPRRLRARGPRSGSPRPARARRIPAPPRRTGEADEARRLPGARRRSCSAGAPIPRVGRRLPVHASARIPTFPLGLVERRSARTPIPAYRAVAATASPPARRARRPAEPAAAARRLLRAWPILPQALQSLTPRAPARRCAPARGSAVGLGLIPPRRDALQRGRRRVLLAAAGARAAWWRSASTRAPRRSLLCESSPPDAELHLVDPFGAHPDALPRGWGATEWATRRATRARAARARRGRAAVHWHVALSHEVARELVGSGRPRVHRRRPLRGGLRAGLESAGPRMSLAGGVVVFHDARAGEPGRARPSRAVGVVDRRFRERADARLDDRRGGRPNSRRCSATRRPAHPVQRSASRKGWTASRVHGCPTPHRRG